jgi:hypothetical protein
MKSETVRFRPAILVTVAFLAIIAVIVSGTTNTPVVAQSPCIAQISYPFTSTTLNPNSNVAVTIPVLATCSFNGGQLYAVGDAFDNSTNTALGSVLAALPSKGGNQFNGQLVFIIPAANRGHSVHFEISIYSDQPNINVNFSAGQQAIANTSLLATTSAQFVVLPEFPASQAFVILASMALAIAVARRRKSRT